MVQQPTNLQKDLGQVRSAQVLPQALSLEGTANAASEKQFDSTEVAVAAAVATAATTEAAVAAAAATVGIVARQRRGLRQSSRGRWRLELQGPKLGPLTQTRH